MTARIVSFSALGSNCWSPDRLAGTCAACFRYDRCTYPERVADERYDAVRVQAAQLKAQSEALYAEANQIAKRYPKKVSVR